MEEIHKVIQAYIKHNNINGISIGEVRGKPVALYNHVDVFEVRALETDNSGSLVLAQVVVPEKVINNQWKTLERNIEEHNKKIKNVLNKIRVVRMLIADNDYNISRLA